MTKTNFKQTINSNKSKKQLQKAGRNKLKDKILFKNNLLN